MTIKVNGEEIPEAAVQFELKQLIKFYTEHMSSEEVMKQIKALKDKAVEQAIGAKLLLAEAARLDLKVSDAEIDKKFEEMAMHAGGKEKFYELLKRQNLTEDNIKQGIERGKRVDMLIEKITEGLRDPTEKEMEDHFKEHAKEYYRPERVQARHILMKPASDSMADKETVRSKLMELRNKIGEGSDFSDMAAAYSECPSGKKTGGSLGWFSRGMMRPEFDEMVFSMDVDETSDVVETSVGYHLINKTGHDEGGEVSFVDAHDKVRDFLRHAKRGAAITAYVEDLRKKAVIEVDDE
jgi:parvulin-like peptidyl-prolyl isomerase